MIKCILFKTIVFKTTNYKIVMFYVIRRHTHELHTIGRLERNPIHCIQKTVFRVFLKYSKYFLHTFVEVFNTAGT